MIFKRILVLLSSIILISNAFASEIRVGILRTPQRNEGGLNINAEYIGLFDAEFLGAEINVGASINLNGYTSSFYTGLVWQKLFENNIFVAAALGGATHNGKLKKESKKKGRTLNNILEPKVLPFFLLSFLSLPL